jgi:hypothetical protein
LLQAKGVAVLSNSPGFVTSVHLPPLKDAQVVLDPPSLDGASPRQPLSDQSAAPQSYVGDELGAAAAALERDLTVVERLELPRITTGVK